MLGQQHVLPPAACRRPARVAALEPSTPGYYTSGGLGIPGRHLGLHCDSVVGLEAVLANGSVVEATADGPHADLLWAMCGGGAGFAVVTRFDLRVHALPDEGRLTSVDVSCCCCWERCCCCAGRQWLLHRPVNSPIPARNNRPLQITYAPGFEGLSAAWAAFQRWLPDADWRFDWTMGISKGRLTFNVSAAWTRAACAVHSRQQ